MIKTENESNRKLQNENNAKRATRRICISHNMNLFVTIEMERWRRNVTDREGGKQKGIEWYNHILLNFNRSSKCSRHLWNVLQCDDFDRFLTHVDHTFAFVVFHNYYLFNTRLFCACVYMCVRVFFYFTLWNTFIVAQNWNAA